MAVNQGPWAGGSSNWDPQNISAGFRYDPKTYDPQDYERFRQARQARDKQSLAQANMLAEKLNTDLAKTLSGIVAEKLSPTLDEVQQAVADGSTLRATQESTCFASLEYIPLDDESGTVIGVFQNGYGPYESEPVDLQEFLDWASSDSLGKTYNAEFREIFGTLKPKAKG